MISQGIGINIRQQRTSLAQRFVNRVAADGGEQVLTVSEIAELTRGLETASWLYIPGARKVGIAYAQKPIDGSGDLVVSRLSGATAETRNGTLSSVGPNLARIDFLNGAFRGQPVEPGAVNAIRNPIMTGAAVGAPGALPTHWSQTIPSGWTREITGISVENGINVIDIRFFGTPATSFGYILMETVSGISASVGQQYTISPYLRRTGVFPQGITRIGIEERNSSFVYLTEGATAITPTATTQRFSVQRTISNSNTAFARPYIVMDNLNTSQNYDFTIRIGWPQMELGSVATSFINGTRAADVISRTGMSSLIGQTAGWLFAEVNLTNTPVTPFTRGIAILDGGTLNRNECVDIRQNSAGRIAAVTRVGGANTALLESGPVSGLVRIAFIYGATGNELFVNGVRVGSGAIPSSLPTSLSAIRIGYAFLAQGVFELNDRIRRAAIGIGRPTNAFLQNLTAI